MGSSNTIILRLYARTKDFELEGLPFHLVAPPVGGIEVNYKGIFKKLELDEKLGLYYEVVTVPVLGKSNLPKDKILSITTDGYKYFLLNVEVPFALTKKVVLDFCGVENSGTENLNKLLATGDFSLNPNSKVFIEDVVLISISSTDMEGEIARYNPDVIIIRNNYPVEDKHLPIMKDFIIKPNKYRASNSIIALSTSPRMIEFMKQNNVISTGTLTDINKVNHDAKMDLKFDDITPVNTTVNLKYRYKLPIYASNMVVNGPFGNIGGRYIVLSNTAKYLYRLSEPTIYKYAGAAPFGAQRIQRDDGTSMFSSSNFNILWVGSDTFINSEQDHWMFNSAGQIIDYNSEDYVFKAPNETYNMVLASNGILFANALYWALYNSEYKPSNIQ